MRIINVADCEVIVDDDEYEYLIKFDWHLDKDGYAKTYIKDNSRRGHLDVFMHRLINKTPDNYLTDHINGNILDNRKENLRNCTNQQNQWNSKAQERGSSRYKGVTKRKDGRFEVNIKNPNGKAEYLGLYTNELAAANCYNYYAEKYFGDFARLNDVEPVEWSKYKVNIHKSSKYKGVHISKKSGKWEASIWIDKKTEIFGLLCFRVRGSEL